MAINWKSKLILFKPETVYGTDPTPTAAANAMLMTGVTYSPMEGEDISRDLEFPYLAAQGKLISGLRVRLRGRVELQPSGTAGTAPDWGPLLRSCSVGQVVAAGTSVTYAPISLLPESGTLYFWVGQTRQIVKGVRGDCELQVDAQGIPYLQFDLTGFYAQPSEVVQATPTLSRFKRPKVATKANTPVFTVNAVPLVMRSFRLALNNAVVPRFLVNNEEVVITDRQETIRTRVEAVPLTTFNPFALAEAGTQVATVLTHGTTAGSIATLSLPTCEVGRMPDYQSQDNVLEWDLPMTPLPNAGNDQWTLTLT